MSTGQPNHPRGAFHRTARRWCCAALLLALAACAGSKRALAPAGARAGARAGVQTGQGSYYADKFAGRLTASGVPYRPHQLTAAHNTLPFGTRIEVTNQRNGRTVQVTVNDRGPHVPGRIVDVSKEAARRLGLLEAGVVPVQVRVLGAARERR